MSTITVLPDGTIRIETPGGPADLQQLQERMTMAETNIDRIQREVAETQAQSVAVIAALTAASANIAALSAQVQDLIANGATGEQLNALADALDATQKSVDSVLSPVEPPADVPADVPPADEGTPTP